MGDTFDLLAKGLAERISRRRSLKLMLGGVLGTAAASALPRIALGDQGDPGGRDFVNCCFDRCSDPELNQGFGRGACIKACRRLGKRGFNVCKLGLCNDPNKCGSGRICFSIQGDGEICVKPQP